MGRHENTQVDALVKELTLFPGVGTRTAERMAYHILRMDTGDVERLCGLILAVKRHTKLCSVCFNFSDTDPCRVCSDEDRDRSLLCVVEDARDAVAIERSGAFKGLYHVLMGRISPLEGVDEKDLTIDALVSRVRGGEVREVIIATDPDIEGESTATVVAEALAPFGVKITRIATGIPAGGAIEYASAPVIKDAIEGRRRL